MRATFIRHGESAGNAGAVTHDVVKIALTEKGQRQAKELAGQWTEPPTLIIVSPYLRTRLTAQPTIDRFPNVPVEEWPVQEFTYLEPSRWNGTATAARRPAVEAWWQAADPTYRDGPGAETFSDLLRRVETALERLKALPQGDHALVFSHGQFMQAVRLTVLFPKDTEQEKLARFRDFDRAHPLCNCAMFTAKLDCSAAWRI